MKNKAVLNSKYRYRNCFIIFLAFIGQINHAGFPPFTMGVPIKTEQ